jgi:hypothetical protein
MLDLLERPTAAVEDGDRVAELLRGFLVSKVCFTALELGVFEALADYQLSADMLAARLRTHPVATERLCCALRELDLLDQHEGRYSLTSLARRYLVEDSPSYMGDIALLYSWDTYPLYQYLDLAIREGPGWQRQALCGASLDGLLAQPERLGRLTMAMERSSKRAAESLLASYNVGAHDGLVALGGGAAELCIAAAHQYPRLRCALFDQPHVCAGAERLIGEAGLSTRVMVWPGNMFAPFAIPRAGDLIVLGRVLHLWDDDRALEILCACADALPPGGTLLIHEQLLDSGSAGPTLQNLTTFMLSGGHERSAAEYLELIEDAGLQAAEVRALAGPFSLVIAQRKRLIGR